MVPGAGFAQDGFCVSTNQSGTISIFSTRPYSALYTATGFNGSYNQVGVTDTSIISNTIFFNNFNGNTEVHWFYFVFDTGLNSDTLSNILLTVDQANSNGIAILNWNKPFSENFEPLDPTMGFRVFREFPSGIWTQINEVSFNETQYRDTIEICSDTINYRIDFLNRSIDGLEFCTSKSNIAGDNFNNNLPPDIPEILWVEVDAASGFAKINWNRPPQGDVQGYVIVENVGGFSVAIDTIWDDLVTEYLDLNSDPSTQVYTYGIAAFDTCINPITNFFYISPPTALLDMQHTILLESEYFGCELRIDFKWNKYDNWPGGVGKYELYERKNNGPYQLLQLFGASDTSFTKTNLSANDEYCYFIKAIDVSGLRHSFSNIICQSTDYPKQPDVIYLSSVKADFADNNAQVISLYVSDEPGIDIQGFIFEGSYPETAGYIDIGSVAYSGQSLISFKDTSNHQNSENFYRVQVIDGCGIRNNLSNQINNINLSLITDNEEARNTLLWNSAFGREGDITGYRLYRLQNATGNIGSIVYEAGSSENFYEDDLADFWQEDGEYCYAVQTIETNNPYIQDSSWSNMACGTIKARVWVPNGFIINGSVPTFNPVFAYADLSNYQMLIFDRSGTLLYSTIDQNAGWDGTYKGSTVEQGAYVYLIEFNNGDGQLITLKGTVTVFGGG